MARGVLDNQDLVHTGLINATYSAADATDGLQFQNAGTGKDLVLHVKNGAGVNCEVTVEIPAELEGKYPVEYNTAGDARGNVIDVPAGQEAFIGQFTKSTFNQTGVDTVAGELNYVFLDFENDTSITVALLELVVT